MQMTLLEDMMQMFKSQDERPLKRLKIGWKQIMLNVTRENSVLNLVKNCCIRTGG